MGQNENKPNRKIGRLLGLGIASLFSFTTAQTAFAQDGLQAIEEMKRRAAPVQQHRDLSQFAGSFKAVATFKAGAGAQPRTAPCRAKLKMVLGGRFLSQSLTCRSNLLDLNAISYIGFDRSVGRFTGSWMADNQTATTAIIGGWDEANKRYIFRANGIDPSTNRAKVFQMVMKPRGPSRFTFGLVDVDKNGVTYTPLTVEYEKK